MSLHPQKHAGCHFWGIFMSNAGTNFYAWKLDRDHVTFEIPRGRVAVDDVRLLVTWKENSKRDLKAIVSFKAKDTEQKWAQIEFEKKHISFETADGSFRFKRALPEDKSGKREEYEVDVSLSHDDTVTLKTLLEEDLMTD